MLEIWKDIEGHEGAYMVSDQGRVKSIDRLIEYSNGRDHHFKGRILKHNINRKGYALIELNLRAKKTVFTVHRLVATAFLGYETIGRPAKRNEIVVDHINHVRDDNRLVNLRLVTQGENLRKKLIAKTSIYTGVSFNKRAGKWHSQIQVDGKKMHLGFFEDEPEAHNAYQKALSELENQ